MYIYINVLVYDYLFRASVRDAPPLGFQPFKIEFYAHSPPPPPPKCL